MNRTVGMKLLNKLAERDADWLRMAQSFGLNEEWARELVQDMYVKLYERPLTRRSNMETMT